MGSRETTKRQYDINLRYFLLFVYIFSKQISSLNLLQNTLYIHVTPKIRSRITEGSQKYL